MSAEQPTPTNGTRTEDTWAKPVDRLKVSEAHKEAINLNVDGRHLTSPLNGFGQLWQKTYQVYFKNQDLTPEEVVKRWKATLPDLMPPDSRFYPTLSGVKPGEILLINATVPGLPGGVPVSTGVLVLYADEVSFSVMTPEGHPEAGFNTFSAHRDGEVTVAQVQSLARANDPLFEFGLRYIGGARTQENVWHHVLTQLAASFGEPDCEVVMKKVCVDNRVQWSQARNIWHNAIIRTVLASPLQTLKHMLGRK